MGLYVQVFEGDNTMIDLAGRQIGIGHAPFIIAEMSGNHNQSLDRALEIVDAARNRVRMP